MRQQNAMARQLQLGELRRQRESDLVTTTVLTAQQHVAEVTWQQRHQAENLQRAEVVRNSIRTHRHEVAIEIGKKQAEREGELEWIRSKQKQLRDIKRMLNEPFFGIDPGSGLDPGGLGLVQTPCSSMHATAPAP